ncbi:MAG: hypothetical protein ACOYMN_06525 [Roseimicrobium sp.]
MRELVINLETTSRCNRKCVVCPQAFEDSGLVKKDMSLELLDLLLNRVREAQGEGLVVREIINAGYGETVIHQHFAEVCERYAKFKAEQRAQGRTKPVISVVSNASQWDEANLALVCRAADILKLSFPTCDPEHYGEIMVGNRAVGAKLLEVARASLANCMAAYRDGRIPELRIHISPPTRHTHEHFPETIDFLTKLAAEVKLDNLRLVTFASTSNRAGSVKETDEPDEAFLNNFFRDHRRRFEGRLFNGVRVVMLSELHVFFPRITEVISVLKHPFPCIWKAGSMSIDSSGNYRLCINDAASEAPLGNMRADSIATIVNRMERALPDSICTGCNQHPARLGDDFLQRLYRTAARVRMKIAGAL